MPGIITTDDWIGRLPPSVRTEIEGKMTRVNVTGGSEFSVAGDAPNAIYRVESGYLRLVGQQADGRQILITIYGPGACFAETALIANRPLNHTTIAMTDACISTIKGPDFWELFERNREISDALCRKFSLVISAQILYREARTQVRLARSIAALFDEMAEVCGKLHADGAVEIPIPLTQIDIAEHFDVTRQTVHRELAELRNSRMIQKYGCGWLIGDRVQLAAFKSACGSLDY